MKKILIAALMWPLLALAQSYPSPTFQNLTVNGTFTATGKVGLASLAAQAANTVVANATNASASPTAVVVTGCNGAAQALQWTNGSGFGCNSSIATSGANANITSLSGLTTALSVAQGGTGRQTLTAHGVLVGEGTAAINQLAVGTTGQVLVGATGADPAFGSSVGALTFTGAITPSSTAGIVGTTTNDNANAGSVGEYVTATAGPTSISSATNTNITSISLTAGDWDVWGAFNYSAAATTTTSSIQVGISSVSGTLPSNPMSYFSSGTFPTNAIQQHAVPQQRFSLSGTTTIYMVITATFATSTATAQAMIAARRVR